jgi:hypothetical protein
LACRPCVRRGAITLRELFKQRHQLDQDTAARTLDDYSKALRASKLSRIGRYQDLEDAGAPELVHEIRSQLAAIFELD